ncbi:MAG TPA: AI-2E family transporter [Terriglobales bacterium]|nr:AI-2E family transporter [Terriglobales bacterium]
MKDTHNHRADILYFFLLGIAIYVAYQVKTVLMTIYLGILFAVVLAPAIDAVRRVRIGKYHPGRGAAVIVLLLGLIGTLVIFLMFALPPIFRDIQGLAENAPAKFAALSEKVRHLPFMENFDSSKVQGYLTGVMGGAFEVVQKMAGGVFGIFTFIIITAYFILDGERAFYWALSMFEAKRRERLERTLIRAEKRMRHWLVGQAALMFILGISSLIVFGLLKLKYFYALAVICGLANIIPIIGPIVSVTLACVVALVDQPVKVLGVLGFYLVYQQTETAFLTPKIMKTTVDLPPLAVIISLSLGGALAGVIGALVAVPTAALCAVLIDEYLVDHDAPRGPEEE